MLRCIVLHIVVSCAAACRRFVVNIKLSATKTVPFVVYDDAASAKELATSFARIHGLDGKAVEVLTGVLQQHIDARKEALKAQDTPHA